MIKNLKKTAIEKKWVFFNKIFKFREISELIFTSRKWLIEYNPCVLNAKFRKLNLIIKIINKIVNNFKMVRIKFKCFRLSTKSHHNKLKKNL